jgi:hypothetical protein
MLHMRNFKLGRIVEAHQCTIHRLLQYRHAWFHTIANCTLPNVLVDSVLDYLGPDD